MKRLLATAVLLLASAGGAGQASADPGADAGLVVDTAGVTWEVGLLPSVSVSWE